MTRIGTDTYTYDANGNQVSGPGRTLTYTAFNKVASIDQGDTTTTTVYLGNVEQVIAEDGSYTYKRYLADGILIEQTHDIKGKRTGETTRHLLYDHLGSVDVITDDMGTVLQDLSFDAWGQRRAPDDWTILALLEQSDTTHGRYTTRGYTGHEMLDAVGIIHMNGRIYDPKLGRFLQVDPVIQFPHYSQSQNRYSYVLNNPLTHTDPTGYFIGKLFKKVFKGLNKAFGDFAPFVGIALLAIPVIQGWVIKSWINAGKPAYWTTYTYDLLGRVVKTTLPDYETDSNDAVIRNSVITTAYTGLTTTTTNGEGQRHTETRNALGEVIRATDNAGAPVTHTYDAWGQRIETATGAGDDPVRVQWTYDARGRRTAVKDPDWTPKTNTARYTYTYNGFDELITQTDRIGNEQVMTYDGLGRLLTRTDYAPDGSDSDYDPDLTGAATWTYDGAMNGLGQVQTVTDTVSGYTRKQDYDTHGRESVTTLAVETARFGSQRQKTYATRQTYDEYGRPYQFFDARLETVRPEDQFTDNVTQVHYNARGYAYQWTDGVQVSGKPRRTYREITAMDARGQVTGEKLGGGVVRTRRTHEAQSGRITGITHRNALLREVQTDSYGWDVLGNLDSRTSRRGNNTLAETFRYDSLNRLTEAKGTHTYHNPDTRTDTAKDLAAQKVTYNALGNITHKSDVGEYAYDSNHPYAVSQTETPDKTTATYYNYDAMGNQTSGDGRILEYTPYHKVKAIFRGSPAEAYFTYGPDRARITRTDVTRDNNGRSTTTTVYLGNVEHVIADNGSSTYKRYLANGAVLITQDHDRFDTRTAEDTHYLVKDHVGSLTGILDQYGAIDQSFSYDAWGQRRNPTDAAILKLLTLRSTLHSQTTPRGFTGHEMLDAVGIIHMNGRIYDPKLGRFLQADPVIQFPHYSQGQNTYSYVLNNPLVYTDPTGYFPIFTALAVVGLIAAEVTTTVIIAAVIGTAVFADSLAQGVPLGKAFLAGVSAAALSAVSVATFPEAGFGWNLVTAQHVATVAVTGGITASLQGGKFGHGFLSAGTGAAVGGIPGLRGLAPGKIAARTVVSAVTAGTVSEITGGKFANAAATAAFFSLISSAAQRASRPNFDDMSNQELADWIQKNGAEFGIETPDGLKVVAIDEYRQFDEVLGWVECSDALCEGRIDTVIYGHYDKRRNQIELFKPAFEAGEHSFALSQSDVRGAVLSREAIAVQSFGHEAAHSMGIDMIRDMAPTHYNAERIGLDAMRHFRNKYE